MDEQQELQALETKEKPGLLLVITGHGKGKTTPAMGIALRFVCAALMLFFIMLPSSAQAFERYNQVVKYDRFFSKYAKRYFGVNFDWRYFKAQAVAESRLKAKAKSKVGAFGIMQIMPRTFKEIVKKNPHIKGSRAQPRWNIAAGIYYDRVLWNTWKAKRPFGDRINFMFGSYNAGKQNILKAQNIAEQMALEENLWEAIEQSLPTITGRHSQETITYVKKINMIKGVLQ